MPPQIVPFIARKLVPLLAALGLVGACATKPGTSGGPGARYIVTAQKSAFYKYGPAQSFGPDFQLEKGAIVTMLEKSWGFSRVMTDTGVGGFVSSDDLKPAPPAPATPKPVLADNSRKPQWSYSKPKESNIRPTPGGPLFDVNDVPMPLPDHYEPPSPKPKFRY
jgi:hypothetical protein